MVSFTDCIRALMVKVGFVFSRIQIFLWFELTRFGIVWFLNSADGWISIGEKLLVAGLFIIELYIIHMRNNSAINNLYNYSYYSFMNIARWEKIEKQFALSVGHSIDFNKSFSVQIFYCCKQFHSASVLVQFQFDIRVVRMFCDVKTAIAVLICSFEIKFILFECDGVLGSSFEADLMNTYHVDDPFWFIWDSLFCRD